MVIVGIRIVGFLGMGGHIGMSLVELVRNRDLVEGGK
jgi:hypothetical protein